MKDRILALLDMLATAEDAGCEIIAESRRLRRLLRKLLAQKGHSGGEELVEAEKRATALVSIAKTKRDELLLVWLAAQEVEERKAAEKGARKDREEARKEWWKKWIKRWREWW
tara:strand:+ start:500 stop:838 length:339 start_codon:yes stop_codon:yes gene_type:complete